MTYQQLSAAFFLSAALLTGCGAPNASGATTPDSGNPSTGSPGASTPAPPGDARAPHPLNVTVSQDTARTQQATIGPAGGNLKVTAADGTVYTLTIPENALLSRHVLSITPVTRIQSLPFTGGLIGAVHLEPEGLQFLEPLTLTIQSPRLLTASNLRGFNSHALGQEFYRQRLSTDGQAVLLTLTHFSNPGVALATSGDDDLVAPLIPTDPVDREENDVVSSLLPDFSRIRPDLQAATASDARLEQSIRKFNQFRANVRTYKSEIQAKSQKDLYEGWTLIAKGIDAAVQRASTSCTAGKLDDVTRILRWVTWVKRNPRLAPYFNGRLDAYEAKVKGCASFRVQLESTYSVRHYRLDDEGLIHDDWSTTHHVTGTVDLTYSLESSALDGPDGVVTEDGYYAQGYENKSYDERRPLPPDCTISGSQTQPGPFVIGSNDTVRSELDLDSLVAPLTEDTTTAALSLAMEAAPLEQFVADCKVTGRVDQDMPLWTQAFSQMRGVDAYGLWQLNNIHLTNGVAEIDLPDHYDGPLLYADGSRSDTDRIAVSGNSRITVLHTPKP